MIRKAMATTVQWRVSTDELLKWSVRLGRQTPVRLPILMIEYGYMPW